MGKSLIIKGADFSANAVPVTPEGYIALTEENSVAQAQLYFALTYPEIPSLSIGDYPNDMLYWQLSAGSTLKLKAGVGGDYYRARFAFLDDVYTSATSLKGKFANETSEIITIPLEDIEVVYTYEIVEDCVLTLYQYDGNLFPEMLIYKP